MFPRFFLYNSMNKSEKFRAIYLYGKVHFMKTGNREEISIMKKCTILTMTAFLTVSAFLTGCGRRTVTGNDMQNNTQNNAQNSTQNNVPKDIGKESAKEIALRDAGIKEEEISGFSVSKETEDGVLIYEVEFDIGEKEYSYDIKAEDGEILYSETDSKLPKADVNIPAPGFSEENARKAALERVSGAVEENLKIKLDVEDGKYVYEGEIYYEEKEYEFKIDADTGDFIEWREENETEAAEEVPKK